MEKEFGFTLLTRNRRGVALTSNGEAVLRHIRLILDSGKKLREEVSLINCLCKGTVKLGAVNSICVNYFPDIIRTFNKNFPFIDVHIYQGGYRDVEIKVADGSLDLGFVSYPTFEDVPSTVPFNDRILCIAPLGFHPSNDGFVTVDDIQKMDFLLSRNSYDRSTMEFIREKKLLANLKHDISTDIVTITLVENGMGISIIPELVLQNQNHKCSIYPLKEFAYRKIAIATPPNQMLSPSAKNL